MKTKTLLLTGVLFLFVATAKSQSLLIDDFEPPRSLYWNPIGEGVVLEIVDNPRPQDYMNKSSKSLKMTYTYSGANQYAGVIIGNVQGLNVGDAGEGNMRYAHVKFYKEVIGKSIVKLQGGPVGNQERSAFIPQGVWYEVVFDFNFTQEGKEAANGAYNELFIMANSDQLSEGEQVVLYIDDVTFSNDPKASNGIPTPTDELAILDNFEDGLINLSTQLNSMEGMTFEVVDNPQKQGINTSDKVLQMNRPVGANAWAGFFATLSPEAALKCDLTKYKYARFKILQDQAGASARFKVEGSSSDPIEKSPIVEPGKINEWEEIVFDLGEGNGLYPKIVLMPDYADNRPSHPIYIDDIQFSRDPIVTRNADLLTVVGTLRVWINDNTADVLFTSEQATLADIIVYNEAGQKIAQQTLTTLVGENRARFSVTQKGIYFVKISMGSNQERVVRFVK